MLRALRPRIYRERRRLVFVTTMAFLAGFLFYLQADFYVNGIHIAYVTGAIYAGVVGTAAMAVCLFLPSMRFMIEAIAISRFGLSLFVLSVPDIGYRILSSPMLTALLVVAGGALISRAVHGRILREETGLRARILPAPLFQRDPPVLQANIWQHRFVNWMDDRPANA